MRELLPPELSWLGALSRAGFAELETELDEVVNSVLELTVEVEFISCDVGEGELSAASSANDSFMPKINKDSVQNTFETSCFD